MEIESKNSTKWDDTLLVGVDVLDNDHKVLFYILNQLEGCLLSDENNSDENIEKILSDLSGCTEFHFNREETLMKACGYPYYENHCLVHSMIRTKVKFYIDAFNNYKSIANLKLLHNFMRAWLVDHIYGMDKHYSPWMLKDENLINKTNQLYESTCRVKKSHDKHERKNKLLVIDDEEDICDAICVSSSRLNYETSYATEGKELANIYSDELSVIVLDIFIPDIDGIQLLRYLADKKCKAAIILMSGKDPTILHSARILAKSRGLNIIGELSKPFSRDDLNNLLAKATVQNVNQNLSTEETFITVQERQTAIDEQQIIPYFQPKVNINTGKPTGFEVLARWHHPTRGLILPGAFIPLSEKFDLIDDLTELMIDKSFALTRLWIKAGLQLNCAINISAKSLKNLDMPEKLIAKTDAYDLATSVVTLEVTESAMTDELADSLDILTRIRMKGFQLSIDDYGTGYSSMMQLSRAPFNELKVDKSFVKNMDEDEENRAICESLIDLALKLNMTVTAEGIETKSVWELLKKFNCTEGQGYYFGRPMPADEFEAWLKNKITVPPGILMDNETSN